MKVALLKKIIENLPLEAEVLVDDKALASFYKEEKSYSDEKVTTHKVKLQTICNDSYYDR